MSKFRNLQKKIQTEPIFDFSFYFENWVFKVKSAILEGFQMIQNNILEIDEENDFYGSLDKLKSKS